MSKSQFPENFAEYRGEFNDISDSGWNSLSDNDKIKFKELEATKGTKLTDIDRRYAENWQERVETQKQKILERSVATAPAAPIEAGRPAIHSAGGWRGQNALTGAAPGDG